MLRLSAIFQRSASAAPIPAQSSVRSCDPTIVGAVEGGDPPGMDLKDARRRRRWGWRGCGPASGGRTAPPSVWDHDVCTSLMLSRIATPNPEAQSAGVFRGCRRQSASCERQSFWTV